MKKNIAIIATLFILSFAFAQKTSDENTKAIIGKVAEIIEAGIITHELNPMASAYIDMQLGKNKKRPKVEYNQVLLVGHPNELKLFDGDRLNVDAVLVGRYNHYGQTIRKYKFVKNYAK